MSTASSLNEVAQTQCAHTDSTGVLNVNSGMPADPYARWHGFMQTAVIKNGVMVNVANFLNQRVSSAWGNAAP